MKCFDKDGKAKIDTKQTKYELLKEPTEKKKWLYIQIGCLLTLSIVCGVVVYSTWSSIYQSQINIPPKLIDIPHFWANRTMLLINAFNDFNKSNNVKFDSSIKSTLSDVKNSSYIIRIDNEIIYPSELGNFLSSSNDKSEILHSKIALHNRNISRSQQKLVCYYASPSTLKHPNELYPSQIDPFLCTHINVGIVPIRKNRIFVDSILHELFKQMSSLKDTNINLKVLLWIGGPSDSLSFLEMIRNHASRKEFIRSIKFVLEQYRLDGVDLDWEFPITYNKSQIHFSQLLHEIRREYEREHRTYLLSVAVAAPEGIAYFAYDIRVLNQNCDYVNIMTYDYHFYSKSSPFTGLNAPLFKRHNEHSIFATLNINASVSFWNKNGLDKNKIVVGIPTYGHSFRLVNPFNSNLGSPANGFGYVGQEGFVTYTDICWFERNNFFIEKVFDKETCSPYIFAGMEWISYEDKNSISCKTNYIKNNGFGGAMIFSLNTDDFSAYCYYGRQNGHFPLTRAVAEQLYNKLNE